MFLPKKGINMIPEVQYQALVSVEWCCSEAIIIGNYVVQ